MARRKNRSRLRSAALNLLLALVSVVVGLALAEAVAWLVQPPPRPGLPQNMLAVERGVWRMTPNFRGEMDNRVDFRGAAVTADGTGNRIVPAAPPEAPARLLVIGDSQTFGHGLSDQESWPNQLQQDLNARAQAVRVSNLAVPGINIDQYDAKVRNIVDELGPADTVLIGVSWNDLITPPSQVEANILVEGYLVSAQAAQNVEEAKARVRVFEFTGIVVPPLQNVKDFFDSLSQSSALVGIVYPRAKAIYYRLRSQSPVRSLVTDGVPEANVLWLRRIADRVEGRGARLVTVLLPERMFFEDGAYNIYSVNGREFPTPDYQAYLATPLCQKFNLTCVNAFPLLHEHQSEGLAFKIDGHFTPKAASLLGHWLARRLYP